ncbi:MAG: AAA family ATPase [Treponema sp.]|nr:AAA family ATPase [Treponema sp.]
MKPLELTMNAFGSYAGNQIIDFASLGNKGLYLITGETGSGKTTIFDAISFALYGKASGTSRSDSTMLRSDYVTGKEKTFAQLKFACGKSVYTIKRTIKKNAQDADLILSDGTVISGNKNVNPKIEEIIGLDSNQFAQIIMIAQNDFQRFLKSKVSDRAEILRHIFETEILKTFQKRLKDRAKEEKDNLDLIIRDFDRYNADIYKREEKFAEWEEQIKSDKTELSKTDKSLAENNIIIQELAVKLSEAQKLGKDFSDLAAFFDMMKKHEAMADEIKSCKERAVRGETALRKVKPACDTAARTAAEHAAAAAALSDAKTQENTASLELEQAEVSFNELPNLEEAQVSFTALSKECEAAFEKLNKLNLLKKNSDDIAKKQKELASRQEELVLVCKTLEELPAIDDEQIKRLAQELSESEDKFSELIKLKNDLDKIKEKQEIFSVLNSELEIINGDFLTAQKMFNDLENAFFLSHAGILVTKLKEGEPCPVCGSAVHPNPAAISGMGGLAANAPREITNAEYQKAKNEKENALEKCENKSKACGTVNTEIKTLSGVFINNLSVYIPDIKLENAGKQLEEMTNTVKNNIEELTKKKANEEKTNLELKIKFDNAAEKQQVLNKIADSLKVEIETLIKRFTEDFSDFSKKTEWEEAKDELTQLLLQMQKTSDTLALEKETGEKELVLLVKEQKSASERKNKAQAAFTKAQAVTAERKTSEQEKNSQNGEAQVKYSETLAKHGFSDEEEYTLALISEEELANLIKKQSDYEKNGEQLKRDIKRLEKETQGKEQPDLEKIKNEKEAADTKSLELLKEREEIKSRFDKTTSMLKELRRAAVNFEQTEKSYAAVKQLSDAANAKFDFETYAQTAYFESVLHAANKRLNKMSQSRYILQRQTEGEDKRKSMGLEIEVFDSYTGKARPSSSLSGGETFMASLSLALGLSDVVQQTAGGIHLDAMFIDEGFGSLDAETMDVAIKTLTEMAGTDRIIGIISHVTELRERIDKQIQIEKTTSGSRINMAV